MPDDDEAMYEYYSDPDHRVAAGPGRRRTSKPLSTHVPIRDVVEAEVERK